MSSMTSRLIVGALSFDEPQSHVELSAALTLYWALEMTLWVLSMEAALTQVEG